MAANFAKITVSRVIPGVKIMNVAFVGLMLKADTRSGMFQVVAHPYGTGTLVSWPDPKERLRLAIEAYGKLERGES